MTGNEALSSIVFTRPTFLVLSGYSGVGKSTVREKIIGAIPGSRFSVSVTTRVRREHEREGEDYIFVSGERFRTMIDEDGFLEFEEVHGNYYGTPVQPVNDARKSPGLFIFDVDVYGGITIKKKIPEAILVFLQPPDLDELRKRLAGRKTEDDAAIGKRLARIPKEQELSQQYDYRVTNAVLDDALVEIAGIIRGFQDR